MSPHTKNNSHSRMQKCKKLKIQPYGQNIFNIDSSLKRSVIMSELSPMVDIRAGLERRDAQDGPTVRWIVWFGEGVGEGGGGDYIYQ